MFALFSGLTGIDTLYDGVHYRVPPLLASVGLLCITGGIILRTGTAPEFGIPEPLRRLLTMFGCPIVAPLLLLDAYAGFRIAESQFDQVRNNLITEAPVLSAEVDRKIIGEIERLQTLAASPSLRHGTLSSSGARLKPHWACAKAATSCRRPEHAAAQGRITNEGDYDRRVYGAERHRGGGGRSGLPQRE
jgi:hypothetical protein